MPFFNQHPLFQEMPPAVFTMIDNFQIKHPDFDVPKSLQKVVTLNSKVHDILSANSAKKNKVTPSGSHSDYIKKSKSPVCFLLSSISFPDFSFQGKRPCISKEFIDNDSDGDLPALFLDVPATLTIKLSSFRMTTSSVDHEVVIDSGSNIHMDIDMGMFSSFIFANIFLMLLFQNPSLLLSPTMV